ncbi:unnamed protein product [Cylicocyclus nassatus]|uniref:Uncharacterized protein n=1 Tax=Cylicocyclus nassatus TaxID=53992 RepID=A0AA36DLY5_CYLNA|nr:unnamed protein product [Cylicocyclus nassatus]
MRFLPRKIAPVCDAVTLWKKSEILQRRREIGLNRLEGQDYMPSIIRSQLRNRWMKEYAEIKVKKSCRRLEALCEVHSKSVVGKLAICEEGIGKQLSFLFVQWMAKTYEKDPQPDPRRTNPSESELQRMLAHYFDFRNNLKVLKLPYRRYYAEEDPYVMALENYLKTFQNESFQFCHLVVPNENGNLTSLKFLQTPSNKIKELMDLEEDSEEVVRDEQHGRR